MFYCMVLQVVYIVLTMSHGVSELSLGYKTYVIAYHYYQVVCVRDSVRTLQRTT